MTELEHPCEVCDTRARQPERPRGARRMSDLLAALRPLKHPVTVGHVAECIGVTVEQAALRLLLLDVRGQVVLRVPSDTNEFEIKDWTVSPVARWPQL